VGVDEARRDDATGGVDVAPGPAQTRTNLNDRVADDAEVGGIPNLARAVDDLPTADRQVEIHVHHHQSELPFRIFRIFALSLPLVDKLRGQPTFDAKQGAMSQSSVDLISIPRSKAGEAYRVLHDDILTGRLRPGEKLAFTKLKAQYPFGLAPFREALIRLAASGLVRGEEQRGFHVAPVSEADLQDVTRVGTMIEGEAVANSILHGTAAGDMALVAAFHQLVAAPPATAADPQSMDDYWSELHSNFHEQLVHCCDSPWLLNIRRVLFDQAERYRRLSFRLSVESRDLVNEHRALMTAVLDRDAERAKNLVTDHGCRTAEIIVRDLPRYLETAG
jgi:GntR family carbon starvation induced transcriptional regulator